MSKLTGNQEFNGDVYIKGVGGYDGTNATASTVSTVQEVIAQQAALIDALMSKVDGFNKSFDKSFL